MKKKTKLRKAISNSVLFSTVVMQMNPVFAVELSKEVTEFIRSKTDQFPVEYIYNKEGYAGTLKKDGVGFLESGSFDKKEIIQKKTAYSTSAFTELIINYNDGKYSGILNKAGNPTATKEKGELIPEDRKKTTMTKTANSAASLPKYFEHSDGDYKGVMYIQGTPVASGTFTDDKSKDVIVTQQSNTKDDFAASIPYNVDGYKGELYKFETPVQGHTGTYTPAEKKEVTVERSSPDASGTGMALTIPYNQDGYSGILSKAGNPESTKISGDYTPGDEKDVSLERSSPDASGTGLDLTIWYEKDGYSGYLSKAGKPERTVISGELIADLSKTVTDSKTSSSKDNLPYYVDYNKDGYSGRLNRSGEPIVASGKYTDAEIKTQTVTVTHRNAVDILKSITYDKDGFKGELEQTGVVGSLSGFTVTYSGKVTKPASDTRVWQVNFSGDVKKPGSDTRKYSYSQKYTGKVVKPAVDTRKYSYTQLYKGEVVKRAVDTRVYYYEQKYKGVVTKPGVDNRVWSVNYEGELIRPEVDTRVFLYTQEYKGEVKTEDTREYRQNYKGVVYANTAPEFTVNPTVSAITTTSAKISWTTDRAATATIEYWVDGSSQKSVKQISLAATTQTIELTGLVEYCLYNCAISASANAKAAYAPALQFRTIASGTVVPAQLVFGDVSGDGKVAVNDYAMIRDYLLGNTDKLLSAYGDIAADVDGNGVVEEQDMLLIRDFVLKRIAAFPVDTKLALNGCNLKNGDIYITSEYNLSPSIIGTSCRYVKLLINNTVVSVQENNDISKDYAYWISSDGLTRVLNNSAKYKVCFVAGNAPLGVQGGREVRSPEIEITIINPDVKSALVKDIQNKLIKMKSYYRITGIDYGLYSENGLLKEKTTASISAFQQWCMNKWIELSRGSFSTLKERNRHLDLSGKVTLGVIDNVTLAALNEESDYATNLLQTKEKQFLVDDFNNIKDYDLYSSLMMLFFKWNELHALESSGRLRSDAPEFTMIAVQMEYIRLLYALKDTDYFTSRYGELPLTKNATTPAFIAERGELEQYYKKQIIEDVIESMYNDLKKFGYYFDHGNVDYYLPLCANNSVISVYFNYVLQTDMADAGRIRTEVRKYLSNQPTELSTAYVHGDTKNKAVVIKNADRYPLKEDIRETFNALYNNKFLRENILETTDSEIYDDEIILSLIKIARSFIEVHVEPVGVEGEEVMAINKADAKNYLKMQAEYARLNYAFKMFKQSSDWSYLVKKYKANFSNIYSKEQRQEYCVKMFKTLLEQQYSNMYAAAGNFLEQSPFNDVVNFPYMFIDHDKNSYVEIQIRLAFPLTTEREHGFIGIVKEYTRLFLMSEQNATKAELDNKVQQIVKYYGADAAKYDVDVGIFLVKSDYYNMEAEVGKIGILDFSTWADIWTLKQDGLKGLVDVLTDRVKALEEAQGKKIVDEIWPKIQVE